MHFALKTNSFRILSLIQCNWSGTMKTFLTQIANFALFPSTVSVFDLFFVKKYLLVGAWGMLWAGESVSGSVDQ